MPAAKLRRLTPPDHQLIQTYTRWGFTGVEIAHVLGCSKNQVQDYLRGLSPRITPLPPVAITRSQYVLIQRFEASTFPIEELATQLVVDSLLLLAELRGRKTMSFKRMHVLNAFFAAHTPTLTNTRLP